MAVAQELIDIVACPKCKGKVKLLEDGSGFACSGCKLLYPIQDDIPNFLIEEAKALP
jgi:uncharacterized protein YbaR (Trm112 family)